MKNGYFCFADKTTRSAEEFFPMFKVISGKDVVKCCREVLGDILHSKQVVSIANAVYGSMIAHRLGSADVGRGLAMAEDLVPKHAIKQVDRMLGNAKIDTLACQEHYVRWLLGERRQVVVSMDWTEYGREGQSRLSLNLITSHGRATPLLWRTYESTRLKNRRSQYERALVERLHFILHPLGVHVTVLADRGFADNRLYNLIHHQLHWDFVIRFRCNMWVTSAEGERRRAKDWVACNGQARLLAQAQVTAANPKRWSVVFVKRQGMQEPWNLVSSIQANGEHLVQLYARRFSCEEQFRDEKDDRFGMGSKETRVSTTARRDRWVLINALATVLLTLLGAAAEAHGYDRRIRANTLRRRTHSLFRLGRECLKGVARCFQDCMRNTFQMFLVQQRTTTDVLSII